MKAERQMRCLKSGARLKSSLWREREGADRERDRIRSRGEAHLRLDPATRDVSTF